MKRISIVFGFLLLGSIEIYAMDSSQLLEQSNEETNNETYESFIKNRVSQAAEELAQDGVMGESVYDVCPRQSTDGELQFVNKEGVSFLGQEEEEIKQKIVHLISELSIINPFICGYEHSTVLEMIEVLEESAASLQTNARIEREKSKALINIMSKEIEKYKKISISLEQEKEALRNQMDDVSNEAFELIDKKVQKKVAQIIVDRERELKRDFSDTVLYMRTQLDNKDEKIKEQEQYIKEKELNSSWWNRWGKSTTCAAGGAFIGGVVVWNFMKGNSPVPKSSWF